MPDHISLDRNQSVALIDCLLKAAELGERTGNLDLAATALYCADLLKTNGWPEESSDV